MHVLVVDDEDLARQRLIKLVERIEGFTVIGEAVNGEQAILQVEKLDPEIVLLDVRMPGVDGLNAADTIAKLPEPPAIIFCTAYDQYALKAFEANAEGYLVKPVEQQKLESALHKARKLNKAQRVNLESDIQPSRKSIQARTHSGIQLIPIEDVYCFHADQKYVTAIHKNGEVLIDETLKELEQELSASFIRIHRNALVNVQQITGTLKVDASQTALTLRDSELRPVVSRRHLANVKELIARL